MKPLILNRPHLIVMLGLPGSGKSFFADHFANTFMAPIVSLKQLQKEIYLNQLPTKEEEKAVNRVIGYMLGETMKTERTVVLDGPIFLSGSSDFINKITNKFGYEPLYVWVQTDPITSKKRAVRSSDDKHAIKPEQFDELAKQFTPPKRAKKIIVISGKHTYASQLKIVLKYLAEPI